MGDSFERIKTIPVVWHGKQYLFQKVWAGHEFTQSEIDDLLAGKTIAIEGFDSINGKSFRCKGILCEQEYNGKTFIGFENLAFIYPSPDGQDDPQW